MKTSGNFPSWAGDEEPFRVAGKMFEVLARGVNIDMISTSEIKISVVIDLAKGESAMKALHAAFVRAAAAGLIPQTQSEASPATCRRG